MERNRLPSSSPFRHRSFRLFWFTRTSSALAYQMLAVAVGWQMYALTGSALDLGLVGLFQFVPMLLLTPIVGHVADRYDRRTIVSVCQAITMVGATGFAIGSVAGWLSRDAMFLVVAALGASRAFENPATSALLSAVVPRDALRQASAASSAASQTAQIVGPALGGLFYSFISPAAVYVCVACIAMGGAVLATSIRMAHQAPRAKPPGFASLFAGVAFVMHTPIILGTLSLDLVAVLLGGATALLPVFAATILHTGPWGLGLLRSAPAMGALSASLILARRPIQTHAGFTMLAGVGLFGVATVVFGLSRSLPLSLLALAVLGAADTVSVVVRLTLVQLRTPPEMLGRVSAVNSLFVGCSNQLGEFESGTTAALFGTVPAVLIGGIGTVLAAALWALLFPTLRGLRTLDEPPSASVAGVLADEAT